MSEDTTNSPSEKPSQPPPRDPSQATSVPALGRAAFGACGGALVGCLLGAFLGMIAGSVAYRISQKLVGKEGAPVACELAAALAGFGLAVASGARVETFRDRIPSALLGTLAWAALRLIGWWHLNWRMDGHLLAWSLPGGIIATPGLARSMAISLGLENQPIHVYGKGVVFVFIAEILDRLLAVFVRGVWRGGVIGMIGGAIGGLCGGLVFGAAGGEMGQMTIGGMWNAGLFAAVLGTVGGTMGGLQVARIEQQRLAMLDQITERL